MNLPITMKPEEYGNVLVDNFVQIDGQSIHRFMVESGTRTYTIDVSKDGLTNKVKIQGAVDLQWIDTKISDEVFRREIGKSIIFFMGGERILRKKQLNAKPFNRVSTDNQLNSNFITMDIETVKLDNKITPYLICAYNGTDYITSYANESLDQKTLFNSFIMGLLSFFKANSNSITVYAHNLSGFDGILLMKHCLSFGQVDPLLHNGKLISIKLKLNIIGYKSKTVIFKDSFLLLPLSLRKLCSAFNVINPKGYFPFKFTNIFYKGLLPLIEYWKDITQMEYDSLHLQFPGGNWSFKDESIKYCKLDCQCLFDVLIKFNELIFNEFKLNVNNSSTFTLPSLAMRIYKSQYMPKNTIYQLLGRVEKDIRQSYTGGAVDVYIPHNRGEGFFTKLSKTLYYYDINSLYPFVMAKTLMPVGKPIAFEGDIRAIDPKAYGFFYCKITSPDYLDHPILQRRIRTSDGLIRTIAGLGSWQGWIASHEMDNAMKFGYEFEIIRGYQFELGDIFSTYIEKLYNLRLQYGKGTPMNLIAKLLMNSLYGKFGMSLEKTQVEIYDTTDKADLELFNEMLISLEYTVSDYIKIDNFYVMVRKTAPELSNDDQPYHGVDVNIAIASAITAGARMWMSQFKNNPNYKLYYSDTDCAVLVGLGLGQMKLEHVITKAVFLAPKVYALISDQGEQIIKAKGLTRDVIKDITIADFEFLLTKDSSRLFNQSKLYKSLYGDNLPELKNTIYTLKTL